MNSTWSPLLHENACRLGEHVEASARVKHSGQLGRDPLKGERWRETGSRDGLIFTNVLDPIARYRECVVETKDRAIAVYWIELVDHSRLSSPAGLEKAETGNGIRDEIARVSMADGESPLALDADHFAISHSLSGLVL
jgi:hypothetical protein